MTPSNEPESAPLRPAILQKVGARDVHVVGALETALSGSVNTLRTYVARWLSFADWCHSVGLSPLPATPDTVVCYLEAHADRGSGSSLATLRHTASVITKVHELEGHPSPCKDRSVKESLKRLRFRLARPRVKVGALTPRNCDWISSFADLPRDRGRGQEREAHAARRGLVDVALAYVLSEAGLRAAEASELKWGDVQRWDDGSGRITVPGSQTGIWTEGAIVAITGKTMEALDAMRPSDAASDDRVFGLSASQIVRRVKAAAEVAWIENWKAFNGSSGRVGLVIRLAEKEAPERVVERQARRMQRNGIVGRYTSGECAAEALQYL